LIHARRRVASKCGPLGAIALAAVNCAATTAEAPVHMSAAQSHYLESCGGCHGILGSSSKKEVPELRGAVGQFLCTPAGREYIVRLPNVAFADLDDRQLADVMNFVVFGLGGLSIPPGARPYSAAEVGALRTQPLKNSSLARMRRIVLAQAISACLPRGPPARPLRLTALPGR
jgi:hypothetical protein